MEKLTTLSEARVVSVKEYEQDQRVPPQAVELAAEHAQHQDPSVVERASDFYSQHPKLVQALGAGAALLVLKHLSHA